MSYRLANITSDKAFIIDNDDGISITNSAEKVVAEINQKYPGVRIIYRDTEGTWDELLHNNGVFVNFAPYREGLWGRLGHPQDPK